MGTSYCEVCGRALPTQTGAGRRRVVHEGDCKTALKHAQKARAALLRVEASLDSHYRLKFRHRAKALADSLKVWT